jgi:hypothetical protein
MVIVIINYWILKFAIMYNMFTLEQQIFIVQCFFSNGERLENDEWSIRYLEFLRNFNKSSKQLAQKVYKCVNMFLETSSVLRKKGSRRPTKRSAENIEKVEQRIV